MKCVPASNDNVFHHILKPYLSSELQAASRFPPGSCTWTLSPCCLASGCVPAASITPISLLWTCVLKKPQKQSKPQRHGDWNHTEWLVSLTGERESLPDGMSSKHPLDPVHPLVVRSGISAQAPDGQYWMNLIAIVVSIGVFPLLPMPFFGGGGVGWRERVFNVFIATQKRVK